MAQRHWSSCSLHSGPAAWPMPCDCGGFTGGTPPGQSMDHADCSRAARLERFAQLWRARIDYLRDNFEMPVRYRLKVAMRKASGGLIYRNLHNAAQLPD